MFGVKINPDECFPLVPQIEERQSPDELWLSYIKEDLLSGMLTAEEVLTLILET